MFVVVTRQILTENQAQGVCPEVRDRGGTRGGTGVCVCVCVPPPKSQIIPPPRRAKPPTAAPRTATARGRASPQAAVSLGVILGGYPPKSYGMSPPPVLTAAPRGADGALRALQRHPAHLRDPRLVPARGGHRQRVSPGVGGIKQGRGAAGPRPPPLQAPPRLLAPQPGDAGGRELHPLHQEQRPLPALRLREVSGTTGTGDGVSPAGTSQPCVCPPPATSPFVPCPPPRANLPPQASAEELRRCRFHPERQPLCPILRLGDVARFAGQDFAALATTVSQGDTGGGARGHTHGGHGGRGDTGTQQRGEWSTWVLGHGDMGTWGCGI